MKDWPFLWDCLSRVWLETNWLSFLLLMLVQIKWKIYFLNPSRLYHGTETNQYQSPKKVSCIYHMSLYILLCCLSILFIALLSFQDYNLISKPCIKLLWREPSSLDQPFLDNIFTVINIEQPLANQLHPV